MRAIGLIFYFVLFIFNIQNAFSQSYQSPSNLVVAPVIVDNSESHISLIDSIINFSKKYIGRPYRGGGKGPNSFDCSGFTSFVFSNFGIKLDSSSDAQARQLPTVAKKDILPGDLVFFNGHQHGSRVGHVGLVISKHEDGTFDFIHSATSKGISITNSESYYFNSRYVKAGRVFTTDSLLANYKYNKQNIAEELDNNAQTEACSNEKVLQTTINQSDTDTYHTVKKKETLYSISKKFGVKVNDLIRINNLNNENIFVGQRLKISGNVKIDVAQETKTTNSDIITKQKSKIHIVKSGDTLWNLSKKYNCTVREIMDWNGKSNNKLSLGEKLKIVI